jgi:glutamine---fructose-6-phosphate transaminase (isomerizing)
MTGELMAAEMGEQPEVLRRLLSRRAEIKSSLGSRLPDDVRGVVLVARGSSDHAAIYGRYAIEVASGLPVTLAAPSLVTLYRAEVDYQGFLAVAISQSGETPEIVSVLRCLSELGAFGVAITNRADSPLAREAGVVLELGAGDERAVPATKTFTAQLAMLGMMAEALGSPPWRPNDWASVPEAVESALADPAPAREVADEIGDALGTICVGRGFLFPIALEAALKLKETSSILAEGYSAADLRHGPIAVIEEDFPVLLFAASGPTQADVESLADTLDERGARVFVIGDVARADIPVSGTLPEALAVIPAAVRAQQLAFWLARHRGLDPDHPSGLTKVTRTGERSA